MRTPIITFFILTLITSCLETGGGGKPRSPSRPIQDENPLGALKYSADINVYSLGSINPIITTLRAKEVQAEGQDLTFSFKFQVGLEKKLQIMRTLGATSCSGDISAGFNFVLVQESPTRVVLEENLKKGIVYDLQPNESYSIEVIADAVGCSKVEIGLSLWAGQENVDPLEAYECTYDSLSESFIGSFLLDHLTFYDSFNNSFISESRYCGIDLSAKKSSVRLNGEEVTFKFNYEVNEANIYEAEYIYDDFANRSRILCRKNGELEKEYLGHTCKRRIVDSKTFKKEIN